MKLFPTKLLQLFIILLLCNLPYIASLGSRHKLSAQNHLENTNNAYISSLKALKKRAIIPIQKETSSDFSIGLGPIYYTNWVKYIHFPRNLKELESAKRRLKYEEAFKFMFKMNCLKLNSQNNIGLSRNVPYKKVLEFIQTLPFTLTIDQEKAVEVIFLSVKFTCPFSPSSKNKA